MRSTPRPFSSKLYVRKAGALAAATVLVPHERERGGWVGGRAGGTTVGPLQGVDIRCHAAVGEANTGAPCGAAVHQSAACQVIALSGENKWRLARGGRIRLGFRLGWWWP